MFIPQAYLASENEHAKVTHQRALRLDPGAQREAKERSGLLSPINYMNRKLKVRHEAIEREVILHVYRPVEGPDGWTCVWNCEFIHPLNREICGPDEMSSYYYCLRVIEQFFKNLVQSGYQIWCENEGDNGGFDFGI